MILILIYIIIIIIIIFLNSKINVENFKKLKLTDDALIKLQEIYDIKTNTYNFNKLESTKKILFDDKEYHELFPKGIIIIWGGDDIPKGWVICDGKNGTPDLRNKFVLSANDHSNINETNDGESEITLHESNIPYHRHNFSNDNNISKIKNQSKINTLPSYVVLSYIMKL